MDTSLLPFAFICITSFFTLTNTHCTKAVFMTMTKGMSEQERSQIVERATII